MMNLATIDIGTNTTLLLVAGTDPSVAVLEERAEITRLGRGIGREGALDPEAIARTLAVLREYAATARRHGARIAAVGTEALRRAPNATAFLGPAAEILGTEVEVINGEREAALTFRAVVESFPDAHRGQLVPVRRTRAGALRSGRRARLRGRRLLGRHPRHRGPQWHLDDNVHNFVHSAKKWLICREILSSREFVHSM